MKEENQREALRRILKYFRTNTTKLRRHHALLMSGAGRTGPVRALEAKIELAEEWVKYLEGLDREFSDTINHNLERDVAIATEDEEIDDE